MQRTKRINASINLSRLLGLNPCVNLVRISIDIT
jgi:hypothetical protein